jgi:hypothetical protein
MREALLSNFDTIWVDNLHGNRIASERTPWGQSCETIFNTGEIGPGIKVGTCVSTLLKRGKPTGMPAHVYIRDFWYRAEKKRAALLASLDMDSWNGAQLKQAAESPEGPRPYVEFPPSANTGWKFAPAGKSGFEDWPAFDDLFPKYFQGVNMNRGLDGSVIDTDRSALEARMVDYFSSISFSELQKRYPTLCQPRADYDPKEIRSELKEGGFDKNKILRYLLFPLDARWIYYELENKLLNRPRPELAEHLKSNEFLVGTPQPRRVSESRPLIVSGLFDLHVHDWGSVGFPAEVNPDRGVGGLFKPGPEDLIPTANLSEGVWSALSTAWKLKGDRRGTDAKRLCRALFRYCTAIAHAPQYETDHKDSLAQDWPHIPISKDKTQFDEIVRLGDGIARLLNPLADASAVIKASLGKDTKSLGVVHRVDGANVNETDLRIDYSYYGAATGRWDQRSLKEGEAQRPEWGDVTGDLYLNRSVFLSHVPPEIWRYELGGYPVLKKWLGYRQANRRNGSPLSLQELDVLRDIIHRIGALLTLRPLLDAAYEKASEQAWLLDDFLAPSPEART